MDTGSHSLVLSSPLKIIPISLKIWNVWNFQVTVYINIKVYGTVPSFSFLILGLCVKDPMFIVAWEDQQKLCFNVLNPDKTLRTLQKSNV